jgi:hypothetical protein
VWPAKDRDEITPGINNTTFFNANQSFTDKFAATSLGSD